MPLFIFSSSLRTQVRKQDQSVGYLPTNYLKPHVEQIDLPPPPEQPPAQDELLITTFTLEPDFQYVAYTPSDPPPPKQPVTAPSTKPSSSKKGVEEKPKMFLGANLREMCMREGTLVPAFLWNSTNFIEQTALQQEGIYRLSPQQDLLEKLLGQLEEQPDLPLPSDSVPNVVAQTIKRWFRELEEPVIPHEMWDDFHKLNQFGPDGKSPKRLLKLLTQIPKENLMTMLVLLKHLQHIVANQGKNRMTHHNVGIVFCPCLFRKPGISPQAMLAFQDVEKGILSWMINNVDIMITKYLFPLPPITITLTGPSTYCPKIDRIIEQYQNLSETHLIIFPLPPLYVPRPRQMH
ncbi:putative RhoGAP domain protein [Blattamonas nauphoetae]|uniref:RhoGAP domain protein n=1 Tax=Blattamonas nauphoetae TaxID=2049346 RepID=A0ABQ9YFP7_9EUKA|nr:putative RhoGAP domain protein [Blattamonas nauphoetae]